MKDGSEKDAAMKKLRQHALESGLSGVARVFVGRGTKNEAVVSLADTKGKPRILLSVDGADVPSLQFLDENGKVIYKLPADSLPGPKK
jgi:hypothetical protein